MVQCETRFTKRLKNHVSLKGQQKKLKMNSDITLAPNPPPHRSVQKLASCYCPFARHFGIWHFFSINRMRCATSGLLVLFHTTASIGGVPNPCVRHSWSTVRLECVMSREGKVAPCVGVTDMGLFIFLINDIKESFFFIVLTLLLTTFKETVSHKKSG